MTVKLKRAYDDASPDDGERYLVERLWPRGVTKERLVLSDWLKNVAPSTELRKWYGHKPERWPEFAHRYEQELCTTGASAFEDLVRRARESDIALVFSAKEPSLSGALVLKNLLEGRDAAMPLE